MLRKLKQQIVFDTVTASISFLVRFAFLDLSTLVLSTSIIIKGKMTMKDTIGMGIVPDALKSGTFVVVSSVISVDKVIDNLIALKIMIME